MTDNLPAIAGKKQLSLFERALEARDPYEVAEIIARTPFCPSSFKNKPDDVFIAMMYADQIGLPPLTGLQNIAVINGRPGVWGDAYLAIARSHPMWDEKKFSVWVEGEGRDMVAYATAGRKDGNEMRVPMSYSWRDASDAKKAGTDTYTKYLQSMLMRRASTLAVRFVFSDKLMGITPAEEAHIREFEEPPGATSHVVESGTGSVSDNAPPLPGFAESEIEDADVSAILDESADSDNKAEAPPVKCDEARTIEPPPLPDFNPTRAWKQPDGRAAISRFIAELKKADDIRGAELVKRLSEAGGDEKDRTRKCYNYIEGVKVAFGRQSIEEIINKDPAGGAWYTTTSSILEELINRRKELFPPAEEKKTDDDDLPF